MKLNIVLEGNNYMVYNGEDELFSVACNELGDQVAKLVAKTYMEGYSSGYDQATIDKSDKEEENQ